MKRMMYELFRVELTVRHLGQDATDLMDSLLLCCGDDTSDNIETTQEHLV